MRKIFIALLSLCFFAAPALASDGSLALAASSLNVTTGKTFTVSVKATSNGVAANTVGADIAYPPDLLDVVSVSGPSVITLSIVNGFVSPGLVSFQGGIIPSKVLSSSPVGTILFKAKKAGTASITVASSSGIYADDGKGTDLLAAFEKIDIEIKDAPLEIPAPPPIIEPPIINQPIEIPPVTDIPIVNQPINMPEPVVTIPPEATFDDNENTRQTFMNISIGFATAIGILAAYSIIRFLFVPGKKKKK